MRIGLRRSFNVYLGSWYVLIDVGNELDLSSMGEKRAILPLSYVMNLACVYNKRWLTYTFDRESYIRNIQIYGFRKLMFSLAVF